MNKIKEVFLKFHNDYYENSPIHTIGMRTIEASFKVRSASMEIGKNMFMKRYKEKFGEDMQKAEQDWNQIVSASTKGGIQKFNQWVILQYMENPEAVMSSLRGGNGGDTLDEMLLNFVNLKSRFIGAGKSGNLQEYNLQSFKETYDLVLKSGKVKTKNENKELVVQKGAKLVFETSDGLWKVWNPLTWEASCALADGAYWCTANKESDTHFNSYTANGKKLYIIASTKDRFEKYQLSTENNEFKNYQNQEMVRFTFLLNEPELFKFLSPFMTQSQKETVNENVKWGKKDENEIMAILQGDDENAIISVIKNIEMTDPQKDLVIERFAK